jgi:hypothetical protein
METKVIEPGKVKLNILKWLKKSTGDVDRPALQKINVNGCTLSCDGHRLQAANLSLPTDNPGLADGLYTLTTTAEKAILDIDPEETLSYPQYQQILPAGEPVLEIAVNPQYLIDALQGCDKTRAIRMVFYGGTIPLEVYGHSPEDKVSGESIEVYSLIMPMYLDDNNKPTWRPA